MDNLSSQRGKQQTRVCLELNLFRKLLLSDKLTIYPIELNYIIQHYSESSSHECLRHCAAEALNKGLYSNMGSKKSVKLRASSLFQLYLSIKTENKFQVLSFVMWRRFPAGRILKFNQTNNWCARMFHTVAREIFEPVLSSHN